MYLAILFAETPCLCPSNALVQLQAHYHHCGEAASEKCLSAATFVRPRGRKPHLGGHGDHSNVRLALPTNARARDRAIRRTPPPLRRVDDQSSHSCRASPNNGIRIDSRNRPHTTSSITSDSRCSSPSAVSSHASHPHSGKARTSKRPQRMTTDGKLVKATTMGAAFESAGMSLTLGRVRAARSNS